MQQVTLDSFRTKVRANADMTNTDFIDNITFLDARINANASEVYDLLVNSFADYFVNTRRYDIGAAPTNYLDLPEDIYKLGPLSCVNSDGGTQELSHGNPKEQPIRENAQVQDNRNLLYVLRGGQIIFFAKPVPNTKLLLDYVPMYKDMVAKDDPINWILPVGWENLIIYMTCADCMAKEESDYTYWVGRANSLKTDILESAAAREVTYEGWTDVYAAPAQD